MAKKYTVERKEEQIRITDTLFSYTLILYEPEPENYNDHSKGVFFNAPIPNNILHHQQDGVSLSETIMGITSRDISYYPQELFPINPLGQYCEVGPGLGGFTPYLAHAQGIQKKPIAIDPANYELMGEMLIYAQTLDVSDEIRKRIAIVIERCTTMITPQKVMLINTTLGKAFKIHPKLYGIADVVVEHSGTNLYELSEACTPEDFTPCYRERELRDRVLTLTLTLKKKDGQYHCAF